MSPLALSLMKFGLLVLLYLFVWRALKSVAAGLRSSPAVGVAPPPAPTPQPSRKQAKQQRKNGNGVPASVTIIMKDGKKVGSYKLAGEIDIGRADTCTIHLTDTYASQVHARLSARGPAWVVEDLGSTNGTFLNERRVESPSEVRAGDRIRIGTTVLELRT